MTCEVVSAVVRGKARGYNDCENGIGKSNCSRKVSEADSSAEFIALVSDRELIVMDVILFKNRIGDFPTQLNINCIVRTVALVSSQNGYFVRNPEQSLR